ncbi:MAG: hypothetical protein O2U61_04730 [Candidatus Bathyarchaeota archaeon]|nr:hypothetical protein [Candidatus Bathyarchaeota archaeon]
MRKILIIILIFSLLLPVTQSVLADDPICVQARRVTCDNVATINGEQVEDKCDSETFKTFSRVLVDCKNKVEAEKTAIESQIENIEAQERSAEWYLSKVDLDIRYLNYEITDLSLSISHLESEIELDSVLKEQKEILSDAIRRVYEYDYMSYIEIFLGYSSLSNFGSQLIEMDSIQTAIRTSIEDFQVVKDKIEAEKTKLDKDREVNLEYKKNKEYSQYSLTIKQGQQEYYLQQLAVAKTPLEREMARIETELMELREAMGRIQSYLFSWLWGQRPTWSQIFSAVSSASKKAGVDMFTMLAILQVESSFRATAGWNAGSPEGNLKRCHDYRTSDEPFCSDQKKVFEDICAELGPNFNKNVVPISPAYAMGPAQFIPTTWRGYQRLYSGLRNPWDLDDAVLAMAYKLKRGGVAGYNPGGASWYVPLVQDKADKWREIYRVCGGFNLECKSLRSYLESIGVPTQ